MLSLQDPIHALHGVGPKLQAKLNHYGIAQIADLLFHLPRHYQDRSRLTAIAKLQAYQAALFEGNIDYKMSAIIPISTINNNKDSDWFGKIDQIHQKYGNVPNGTWKSGNVPNELWEFGPQLGI